MKNRVILATFLLATCYIHNHPAGAQKITAISDHGAFEILDRIPANKSAKPWVQPDKFNPFLVNWVNLKAVLSQAPKEDSDKKALVISLPTPDGGWAEFDVVKTDIMHPDLAAKVPGVQTFKGGCRTKPADLLRLDMTPQGFHAQVLSPDGDYYIDPYYEGDNTLHTSHYRTALKPRDWNCGVLDDAATRKSTALKRTKAAPEPVLAGRPMTGPILRTYRMAVAAQGEYTQFHGGTQALGQAAIVTAINRVSGITERDLAVRLQLVANNINIIYTNPGTDPYSENDSTNNNLNENQANIDSVIGNANYDLGHVFNTGGGGLAQVGVPCWDGNKARGSTGLNSPIGDAFYIDLVAHEVGHELGANHSFNGVISNCANRHGPSAYEPGSGSSIMSYAGICGSDNVQSDADAYFAYVSLDEMTTVIDSSGTCAGLSATGNSMPTIDAGKNYSIPAQTPFELTAESTDANGDTLTYCWEQADLGPAAVLSAPDDGAIPLFRSVDPTTNPTRTFPNLVDLLNNISRNTEKLPTMARSMKFTVVVRDNRANGGGINSDGVSLLVDDTTGPFTVVSPNTAVSWSGTETVTWNVAGTTGGGVQAYAVDILLSVDGGFTYPYTLIANAPNDGFQVVTLPPVTSSSARIKVKGSGNVFFDVGNQDFTVTAVPNTVFFVTAGEATVLDNIGNGNSNSHPDPGENTIQVYLPVQVTGNTAVSAVTGTLSSPHPDVSIATASAGYPDLAISGIGSNQTPFVISLGAGFPCGDPVPLLLDLAGNEGNHAVGFNLDTITGSLVVSNSFTPNITIPDAAPDQTPGEVDITLNVPDSGTVLDLDFSIDGTSCNQNPNSGTVGLNHSFVGDLTATLISPSGTQITLFDQINGWSGEFNFCRVRLDDESAGASIQTASSGPHTGTWTPLQSLSAFDGEEAAGNWTLRMRDNGNLDEGRVNSVSLIFTVIDCIPPNASSTHLITVNAPTDGTISPNGSVVVNNGADQAFTFAADTFYHVDAYNSSRDGLVFINGYSTNQLYIWTNVTADGTLDAFFSPTLATNDVPLWWLNMHGQSGPNWDAASLADPDNDGAATWEEFEAGTIPTDPVSALRLHIVAGNLLRWPSVTNRMYDLYWTTNLGQSFTLITNDIPSTPPENSFNDALPPDRAGYYTIRVKK